MPLNQVAADAQWAESSTHGRISTKAEFHTVHLDLCSSEPPVELGGPQWCPRPYPGYQGIAYVHLHLFLWYLNCAAGLKQDRDLLGRCLCIIQPHHSLPCDPAGAAHLGCGRSCPRQGNIIGWDSGSCLSALQGRD